MESTSQEFLHFLNMEKEKKENKQTNKKTHPKSDIRREGEHIIHFESYFFFNGLGMFSTAFI